MRIFLSYSRRDTEFVDRLYDSLTVLGYSVWTDRRRIPGLTDDQWRVAVVEAIEASAVFVIVISPDSTASRSVERELTVAAGKSKRLVPVIGRTSTVPGEFGYGGEIGFEGVFEYELAGVEYVDFTTSSFDNGVQRLSTHLGPTDDASRYNVSELVTAAIAQTAGGHGSDIESSTDQTGTDNESGSLGGGDDDDGIRRRTVGLIAGAVVAVAAIIGLGIALWPSSGSDQDEAGNLVVTSSASTQDVAEDPVVVPSAASEQDEAEDLVSAWADATTLRDWEQVATIDPSHSPDYLENLYRPVSEPTHMFAVHPYVATASRDGALWKLSGAAFAWDYDPEPAVRTHVICSEWVVDLVAGTATWRSGADDIPDGDQALGGDFVPGEQVPADQFASQYDAICT